MAACGRLVKLLKEKGLFITTAESCTGGMIASSIVDVAGASDVFCEGYVTYSGEAKERLLGVLHDTIETHTVVSAEVAMEMAYGAAKAAKADIAITSTGIAGPDGGSEEQPVGLVYIGGFYRDKKVSRRFVFSGDRTAVRRQATDEAINLAIDL